jgi:EAL domain-containing protein (putative c-di-GMP-specific phosphodiesterase class I)
MNASGSGKPDCGTIARSADQRVIDADQTASDADQTASDADQTASDRDEADAASDQRAADRDQANADRQQAVDSGGAGAEAYKSARSARDQSTISRLSTHVARARTTRLRAGMANKRDVIATARDKAAGRRDADAQTRDEAAGRRDADAQTMEHGLAASPTPLAEKIAQLRGRAAADRVSSAADRLTAAEDRADSSRERASLVDRSTELARERALIAETIRGLRAGDTPEATAQTICRQVVTFAGVMAASLLLLGFDGYAWPIGFVVEGQPDPRLRRVPLQRSRHLRERATEGPWIEPWVNQPGHPYNQLFKDLGIHSIACAPVRHNGRLIGLLVADAKGSVEEVAVAEALPALVEFADLAGALIGRDVAERTEAGRGRDHVSGIIAHRAFGPVFQPIVDLRRDEVVGYEALTRFTDGSDPEILFAEAAAAGLGAELETATLEAALAASEALPESAWLNLNASPEFIIAGEPLRTLLAGNRRRLVLVEVTEHTAIADYPAFRAAMDALGPKVEFAVDDAGVGFASLRHILELRPAFVKLDRWLIAGLESDEARQAMIVGLSHFARATGCRLIAEGIETDRELAVLRALTIDLGQGYLLGRPLPIDDIHRPGPARIGSAMPAELMERSQSLD